MFRKLMLVAISLCVMLGMAIQAQAALPTGTILTVDLGNAVQTVPCTAGSCFSMEVSPGFFLYTNIVTQNGIIVGVAQPATGSHSGPPNGTESPDIDQPWSFFGNTGMHQTTSPVIDNDDGTVDMTGWSVTWNAIADIPMGGDPANFPADTGLGSLTVVGSAYTIDYAGHVPLGSPSGFGGVQYEVHLEGSVISAQDPIPNGCVLGIELGNSPSPVAPCTVGSCFSMETSPAFFLYTNISDPNGVELGAIQPATGSHSGPPNGTEGWDIDQPWSFFGNTGMHQTTSPVTDLGGGSIDMTGWDVTWNGIASIPMGGDPANFPVDTGIGSIAIDGPPDVTGTGYTLNYAGHVPLGSPSGFGGVQYEVRLEGSVNCDICTPVANDDVTCDGIDDDCNGQIDDGYVPMNTSCGVGECAATGSTSCVNGVEEDSCVEGTPSPEVCNGLDDDCDGAIDNGIATTPTSCGVGSCASTGVMECQNGQMVDTCVPGPAGTEGPFGDATCSDGADNDCDGATDDADPDCAEICIPSPEVCNGLDDDCDDVVDNGIAPVPSTCGVGECAANGQITCVNGQLVDDCTPGDPIAEICEDGLDNDCDGVVDNGCVICIPTGPDNNCNGIDDDCLNGIDDGYVSMSTSCGVGACASTGSTSCVNGAEQDSCTPGSPSPEVCDGLDNDCNGTADDGLGSTPTTCGIGACASTGIATCENGQIVDTCMPGMPMTEGPNSTDPTCTDGIDNDCDGLTDAEDTADCGVCIKSETIRGGGQRPTTTDLQIQTEFTVLNNGCITDSSNSTIVVDSGTVLAFNCKVGNGPDPDYGELNGVPLSVDSVGVIICDAEITGTDTNKIYLTNKGNGGRDTDRMTIKIAK